ncbi:lysM domain-containing GPI-anchored protein 2 [Prosopis cineraria]|uniref:lysM domain-containing GPI-anchored protein 2 n=1 Tax=Prosopis cineraria TaxID=364024 RepID=UPI00240F6EA5|nr:lysM domain-containing GPI-anchored protein 2 [Prosopis cineraria]
MGGLPRLFLVIIFGAAAASWVVEAQPQARFKCSSEGKTCRSLVDYSSPNETTLGHIQKLFNLKHVLDIVGANAFPSTTRGNRTVGKGQIIKIPFQCRCANGTGLSNKTPLYTIRKDDTLSHIAMGVFSGLVTYQQLQALNNIPDATLIQPGQKVWIPLPCSCDQVDATDAVHYGHLVARGSSFQQIALQYGTTQDALLDLNNISDPKSLQAGQIIDVPLKACSSSTVKNDSLDYPLLVAKGMDTYTANGCVKCSCNNAADNATLQCEPSQVKPYKWDTCPSMLCGNSTIGNVTSAASCTRTICAYAGYNNQTISTALSNESTCSAPTGSGASRNSLQGWGWNHLLMPLYFLFCLSFLVNSNATCP